MHPLFRHFEYSPGLVISSEVEKSLQQEGKLSRLRSLSLATLEMTLSRKNSLSFRGNGFFFRHFERSEAESRNLLSAFRRSYIRVMFQKVCLFIPIVPDEVIKIAQKIDLDQF